MLFLCLQWPWSQRPHAVGYLIEGMAPLIGTVPCRLWLSFQHWIVMSEFMVAGLLVLTERGR